MPDGILVVDGEEQIRETVSSMLAAADYSCQVCGSGMDALRILEHDGSFQVVLCGLMMPDLDGIGLLQRTVEKYPDLPVVMVTAVDDISVALAVIRNGAYDYLMKPFERGQLLHTVSRALENRRLKVESRDYQTNLETLVKAAPTNSKLQW
jgi:DNA-binding NtrC family response regulator